MTMRRFNACFFMAALALNLGCSNAKPEFTDLGSGLPPVLFSGKTFHQVQVLDPNASIPVVGSCDLRTQSLKFKIDGFNEWDSAAVFADGAVVENCQTTGTFNFNLKSLNAMGVWNTSSTVRFTLQAKSVYTTGEGNASSFKVEFIVPTMTVPGQFRLTQGGGISSSSSFKAHSRIGVISGVNAQSTSFKISR